MSKKAGVVSSETKEKILASAAKEFAELGFQGTSLRRICSEAGVTTGAVYFFFKGKEDLFNGVISVGIDPLMEYLKNSYDSTIVSLSKNEGRKDDYDIIDYLIDFYFSHKQIWDIIFAHIDHPSVKKYLEEFIDMSTDKYMDILKAVGKADSVDRFSVSQFIHMQLNTMKTLLTSDFTRDEIITHSRIVARMLHGAFYALIAV